jgi:hypothetical protein
VKKPIARRQFLKENLAATATAVSIFNRVNAQSQIADKTVYRGPLGEFDLADRYLDSLPFTLSNYDTIKPSMSFAANNQAAARAWQITARRKLVELLGGFPAKRVSLEPRVLETKKFKAATPSQSSVICCFLKSFLGGRLRLCVCPVMVAVATTLLE